MKRQKGQQKDRKINGKCTNATNRRSRIWPVYFIYHQAEGTEKCRRSISTQVCQKLRKFDK